MRGLTLLTADNGLLSAVKSVKNAVVVPAVAETLGSEEERHNLADVVKQLFASGWVGNSDGDGRDATYLGMIKGL